MRILVTGGTGYIGSHVTRTLMDQGHHVRLLVRRPELVPRRLGPLGVVPADVVRGDVLDLQTVLDALSGCDAVVHAATLLGHERDDERLNPNAVATSVVLVAAMRHGCDPVVHLSSTVALAGGAGTGGSPGSPYAVAKIAAEEAARSHQGQGHPVVTVYPGVVLGPGNPQLEGATRRVARIARGRYPLRPSGRMHTTDVRDVAAVVAAVMEPGHGPRRYVVPGHVVRGRDLHAAVSEAIGQRRWTVPLPGSRPHLPRHADISPGLSGALFDATLTERELGIRARPFAATVRDTVACMVETGRLPERCRPSAAA